MKPLEQHFIEKKCRIQYEAEIICPFNSSVLVRAVPTGICPGLQRWLL